MFFLRPVSLMLLVVQSVGFRDNSPARALSTHPGGLELTFRPWFCDILPSRALPTTEGHPVSTLCGSDLAYMQAQWELQGQPTTLRSFAALQVLNGYFPVSHFTLAGFDRTPIRHRWLPKMQGLRASAPPISGCRASQPLFGTCIYTASSLHKYLIARYLLELE